MTKPIMLITGTSRGVGLACAEYFQDRYEIVGIARTPGEFVTEQGSVTDENFRQYIIDKYSPDVFINNAGIGGSNLPHEVFRINAEAAACFMLGFYQKMRIGNIINIASWLATVTNNSGGSLGEIAYQSTKKLVKAMSKELSGKKNKPVKVTSLEPQVIDTALSSGLFTFGKPIQPQHIAETIDWVLNQPAWVNIDSVCISNHKES